MNYHYLDKINFPSDLRKFKKNELNNIASELRKKTIEAVSKTGGHLGAGLGVIELTIALHYIFNSNVYKSKCSYLTCGTHSKNNPNDRHGDPYGYPSIRLIFTKRY